MGPATLAGDRQGVTDDILTVPVEYALKLSLAYRETSTLQEAKKETTRKGANMREE